jgi:hypothetical protein
MNLIKQSSQESNIVVFRIFQYSMFVEMFEIGMKYLLKLGLKYNSKVYNPHQQLIEIAENVTYYGVNHYASRIVRNAINENDKTDFLRVSFPELISNMFFHLNGSNYVPICYISDEPIVLKKESMLLNSLFQPITIYFADKRIIFMGTNFVMSDFLQLMCYDWDQQTRDIIETNLNINLNTKRLDDLEEMFADKLNIEPNFLAIKDKLNTLFFDDWTEELYRKFYNIDSTLDNVLKIALGKLIYDQQNSFVDLRSKRLTFIEPLMTQYFKAISKASSLLIKNMQPRNLKMNQSALISSFFTDLDGNVLYDTANGFSAMLAHKASFKNPFGTGQLPQTVANVHFTHKGRICTNSISNQNPGQVVNLIPAQEVDMRTGKFIFTDEELESFKILDIEEEEKMIKLSGII